MQSNPARQGFARKQRGDLSPRAGLHPASVASDSLCRNLSELERLVFLLRENVSSLLSENVTN
ncbi:MAG TPA: hypothetical protein PLZ94_11365, partial [Armatimonadota bacterium]|nr:hypothetical protein [Armatimonadota bacterium]